MHAPPTRALLVLLAALAVAGCDAPPTPAPEPRPVRAVRVPAPETLGRVRYAAVIAARHEAVLAFEQPGRIARRGAEVGDAVPAGTELARLDDTDYRLRVRAADAAARAAQATDADARREAQRLGRLRAGGHVSAAAADRADEQARVAAAQLDRARAEQALARRALEQCVLRAPHAGVLTARHADAGQVVAAGAPVFDLARDDTREAVFDLPEAALAGLPDQVSVQLWARPGQALAARVREVAPRAAPGSRTWRVRATLQDTPPPAALGMSATVEYRPRGAGAALHVPLAALHRDAAGNPAVWVIGADGTVLLRPVELGAPDQDRATVVSGLEPGEWVVTAGVHDLKPGQRVRPL